MFRFLKRIAKKKETDEKMKLDQQFSEEMYHSVQKNVDNIKNILKSPDDLVIRQTTIGKDDHKCALLHIDGLSDEELINDKILKNIPLTIDSAHKPLPSTGYGILDEFEKGLVASSELKRTDSLNDVIFAILSGDTALFVDGADEALIVGTKSWAGRSIEEPVTEALVRGPRDGFTEDIRKNTALVRRRVRDPNLRFDSHLIGRRAKKDLVVIYIEGIVNPVLVEEVNRRLKTLDIDEAAGAGAIEEWLEDSFLSPFPQLQSTERPDKVASNVLQGRVAVIIDGTPFALLAPTTLVSLLQSPEDYYERWQIGTLLRFLRFLAAFITLFLPALYVALTSFHPGMIPSNLAFSIAAAREGVPFPAVIEALVMEATIELLREAGVRLPKPIGQTIGIVGGLIIGEAAVSAGLVSPIMVIVVALTAVASFSLPHYSVAISLRMLRFGVILGAAMFGLFGIIIIYIMINIHIANLKSFGVPYTTPFAPAFMRDWRDVVIRAPITTFKNRPQYLQTKDESRLKTNGRKGS